jgi:hypothetical protein
MTTLVATQAQLAMILVGEYSEARCIYIQSLRRIAARSTPKAPERIPKDEVTTLYRLMNEADDRFVLEPFDDSFFLLWLCSGEFMFRFLLRREAVEGPLMLEFDLGGFVEGQLREEVIRAAVCVASFFRGALVDRQKIKVGAGPTFRSAELVFAVTSERVWLRDARFAVTPRHSVALPWGGEISRNNPRFGEIAAALACIDRLQFAHRLFCSAQSASFFVNAIVKHSRALCESAQEWSELFLGCALDALVGAPCHDDVIDLARFREAKAKHTQEVWDNVRGVNTSLGKIARAIEVLPCQSTQELSKVLLRKAGYADFEPGALLRSIGSLRASLGEGRDGAGLPSATDRAAGLSAARFLQRARELDMPELSLRVECDAALVALKGLWRAGDDFLRKWMDFLTRLVRWFTVGERKEMKKAEAEWRIRQLQEAVGLVRQKPKNPLKAFTPLVLDGASAELTSLETGDSIAPVLKTHEVEEALAQLERITLSESFPSLIGRARVASGVLALECDSSSQEFEPVCPKVAGVAMVTRTDGYDITFLSGPAELKRRLSAGLRLLAPWDAEKSLHGRDAVLFEPDAEAISGVSGLLEEGSAFPDFAEKLWDLILTPMRFKLLVIVDHSTMQKILRAGGVFMNAEQFGAFLWLFERDGGSLYLVILVTCHAGRFVVEALRTLGRRMTPKNVAILTATVGDELLLPVVGSLVVGGGISSLGSGLLSGLDRAILTNPLVSLGALGERLPVSYNTRLFASTELSEFPVSRWVAAPARSSLFRFDQSLPTNSADFLAPGLVVPDGSHARRQAAVQLSIGAGDGAAFGVCDRPHRQARAFPPESLLAFFSAAAQCGVSGAKALAVYCDPRVCSAGCRSTLKAVGEMGWDDDWNGNATSAAMWLAGEVGDGKAAAAIRAAGSCRCDDR